MIAHEVLERADLLVLLLGARGGGGGSRLPLRGVLTRARPDDERGSRGEAPGHEAAARGVHTRSLGLLMCLRNARSRPRSSAVREHARAVVAARGHPEDG